MDFKTLTFSFQITTNNHHYMSSLKFIPELLVVFIFHSFYTCTICILTYGYIMVRFLISGAGFIRRHFLIRESMMQCLLEGASTSLSSLSVCQSLQWSRSSFSILLQLQQNVYLISTPAITEFLIFLPKTTLNKP